MAVVTMKSLLEAGVHFGHQTRRWDPRMSRYIFAERNGIHIIDLQKTLVEVKKAYESVRNVVMDNKYVLFVGTKKQARGSIKREAERCNQFYVDNRWLGGMLTNFTTIRQSIIRLKKIEKMEVDGTFDSLVKKEKLKLLKEKEKLEKNLGGIKNMDSLPGMLFIVDSKKEAIAVSEARKLKIPIVAVVDTNCNPDEVDYPIPGNDDAIRAIELFCSIISNACIDAENEISANIFEEEGEEEKEGETEKNLQDEKQETEDKVKDKKEEIKEEKELKEKSKSIKTSKEDSLKSKDKDLKTKDVEKKKEKEKEKIKEDVKDKKKNKEKDKEKTEEKSEDKEKTKPKENKTKKVESKATDNDKKKKKTKDTEENSKVKKKDKEEVKTKSKTSKTATGDKKAEKNQKNKE